MELSQEEIKSLKSQILEQIKNTFPEDKKQSAISQINSMNDSEFIGFLKQNNLISKEISNTDSPEQIKNISGNPESPFRQIIEGKVPSNKVGENEKALAVLEINPISPGHMIVIPKQPVLELQKLPELSLDLAKSLSEKIKKTLKPKRVLIEPSSVLGEIIINIIPVYNDETSDSQRIPAKTEELEQIKQTLDSLKEKPNSEKSLEVKKQEINISKEKIKLPKRIP